MDDLEGIEGLFVEVFGKERPKGSYSWLFHDGLHKGISVVAEAQGEIVGHAGTIARMLNYGEQEVLMGTSVDAMTHPLWQKRGVNKLLSERLIQENLEAGVGLYGGFSNENSSHAAIKHQGRLSFGPVPLLIRPLKIMTRPWRILSSPPDPLESQGIEWPKDLDDFCASLNFRGVGTVRSSAYLRWRYQRPGGAFYLVEQRNQGNLQGIGVLGLRIKGGLKLGFVMEILSNSEEKNARSKVLQALIDQAKELGCDGLCAIAYRGTELRKTYTRSAFIPTWPRLVGEHLEFSVRTLNPALSEEFLSSKAWHLTWGDSDLV